MLSAARADDWPQWRGPHRNGISSGGRLIIQAGKSGVLAIVEAVPSGYRELRRMKVFTESAATFTASVLAAGRLYCRSYAGEIVCLSLTTAQATR